MKVIYGYILSLLFKNFNVFFFEVELIYNVVPTSVKPESQPSDSIIYIHCFFSIRFPIDFLSHYGLSQDTDYIPCAIQKDFVVYLSYM